MSSCTDLEYILKALKDSATAKEDEEQSFSFLDLFERQRWLRIYIALFSKAKFLALVAEHQGLISYTLRYYILLMYAKPNEIRFTSL